MKFYKGTDNYLINLDLVKKVSLICDRCGQPFKYNVLFDKNGVSVNTIKTPLLCSNCICGDSKNE